MPRYLVLGGNGQLGQALLKVKPDDIELIYPKERCDITSFQQVMSLVINTLPDAVINCAAYTAVDKAEDDVQSAVNVNAYGAANVAKACSEVGVGLVHISTDYVFDGTELETEATKTNPINFYGYSKLFGEELVRAVHPGALIIRTASVYSEFGNNFLKTLLSRYNEGQREFDVVSDHFSCPTYAPDLAETIFSLLEFGVEGNLYHYAGADYVSWYDFAARIFWQVDMSVKINPVSAAKYNSRAQRPAKSNMQTKQLLNPKSLDKGITETMNVLFNKERK